jgi:uncharacterized damage-inducible protein DinB
VNRTLMMTIAATAAAAALQAQTLIPEMKAGYEGTKNKLVRMAEKMPEEHYSFKATPEIRSFGELVAHVADSQAGTCSAINGAPRQLNARSKTAKADLVAALKESFAECDKAWESMNDTTASQTIAGRGGQQRTKLGNLINNRVHSEEEYGYMAVYMRLKGVVPPSSER